MISQESSDTYNYSDYCNSSNLFYDLHKDIKIIVGKYIHKNLTRRMHKELLYKTSEISEYFILIKSK